MCACAHARVRAPRLRRGWRDELDAFVERRVEKEGAANGAAGPDHGHHERAEQAKLHGVGEHVGVINVADRRVGWVGRRDDDGGR